MFWSCLLPLLKFCQICEKPACITSYFEKGSLLIVSLLCENNHESKWYSQPRINEMGAGNLLLAAAILYTGNTYQRIKEMMETLKLSFLSHTTYNTIQKKFLFPAIHHIYTTHRQIRYDNIEEQKEIRLLGDGRCDSPGYCAKYGTYTVMESTSGEILDFHVCHSKMAGSSARMELEGLKKILQRLDNNGLSINGITTDRHKQVRAFLRKERPDIEHQFDIWHVGKNIKKKLVKAAKRKECSDLNEWIKAIINHFWWCCASCNGNATELKEKWVSILNHVVNVHRWEGSNKFKKCAHKKLTKRDKREKNG